MLFDARRALPQVNQDILDAADYIRERGWCQGVGRDAKGQVCIAGALFVVSIIRKGENMDYLADKFGMRPHLWNDAPGRTKDEVIAKLEEIGWAGG